MAVRRGAQSGMDRKKFIIELRSAEQSDLRGRANLTVLVDTIVTIVRQVVV